MRDVTKREDVAGTSEPVGHAPVGHHAANNPIVLGSSLPRDKDVTCPRQKCKIDVPRFFNEHGDKYLHPSKQVLGLVKKKKGE